MSEKSRLKLSETMKEKAYVNGFSPEWRKNVANAVKGRIPWNKGKKIESRNERSKNTKFEQKQLEEIRFLYSEGIAASKIAAQYQCSHHTILKIVRFEGKYAKEEG